MLEATMIIAKMQMNPQNAVGLMSMGGEGPEVLSTLTPELGKLLEGLHRTKIAGRTHFSSSIQVAGLALKHRQERAQRQRIVVFSCSPIDEDEKSLIKLAKRMKKFSVAIDIVGFGDMDDDTRKKLELFHENVDAGGSSTLAIVPPGPNLLSDQLLGTPILGGDGDVGEGATGNANQELNDDFEFGIDPAADPELALALRMSMEEEKARLQREREEREKNENKEKPETIEEGKEDDDNKPGPSSDKKDDKDDKGDTEMQID
ncbi:hypothetical protein KEM56_005533 [Ascosphaera pollenicola]|nr:hypothetical protein KEM56_005533 [Ascosphaera pollenicola]